MTIDVTWRCPAPIGKQVGLYVRCVRTSSHDIWIVEDCVGLGSVSDCVKDFMQPLFVKVRYVAVSDPVTKFYGWLGQTPRSLRPTFGIAALINCMGRRKAPLQFTVLVHHVNPSVELAPKRKAVTNVCRVCQARLLLPFANVNPKSFFQNTCKILRTVPLLNESLQC